MKQNLLIALLAIIVSFQTSAAASTEAELPLIPWPDSVVVLEGDFRLTTTSHLVISEESLLDEASVFAATLQQYHGLSIPTVIGKKSEEGDVQLILDPKVTGSEGTYRLEVQKTRITIRAHDRVGIFYGLQTLSQLIDPLKSDTLRVPAVRIIDQPRFGYRGMHLDVSRHFFPVSFIKRYIDLLAGYKLNVFHWHLTDDQGWRIEIKAYPELQRISAYRNGTRIGHYSSVPEAYDTIRYGGYYSQDEVKEVIAYAAQRHVTIIPEIEMPGHASAALAAYPQLACTAGPFDVARTWGVFNDVFCPKEETFVFLQNVLKEVCALFPGPYVHVGGDECPKERWKACSHCQALMKEKGLKDEHELQSYFIRRTEEFLHTQGKRMIGWDEILEGGLAPDATVMSWRGYAGGIAAAQQGHDVVMTPTSYCYFDYYQSRNPDEPLAIGGYLPLDRVYRFEPIPDALTPEQAKHILGVQANLWTEYITTEDQVEYMVLPRMCALAEVAWTARQKKDYDRFVNRVVAHFKTLSFKGYNYAKAIYDVEASPYPLHGKGVKVELRTPYKYGMIRYTTNLADPSGKDKLYTDPIPVERSKVIRSAVFYGDQRKGNILQQVYKINLATGKDITLTYKPDEEYSRGGGFSLVNGLYGALPWNGADWLGFYGTNLEAVVDLGQPTTIIRVGLDFLRDEGSWVHAPSSVEVYLSSDGKEFTSFGKVSADLIATKERYVLMPVEKVQTRYVKIIATNAGTIPEGKAGAGNPSWLLVDEIVVE